MNKSVAKVYEALKKFKEENKYSPTIQELCDLTGFSSKATIHQHLETLKALGLITWVRGKDRTLQLLFEGVEIVGVGKYENN